MKLPFQGVAHRHRASSCPIECRMNFSTTQPLRIMMLIIVAVVLILSGYTTR